MKAFLKDILDNSFLESLAKSADLYKIGSNSVLDPQEILIGLKVVPRAVMSMMISELAPMDINASTTIQLPFGKDAFMRANKNASDDYTGSIYSDNKIVYSFQNRSIPGLALILMSTFELYDLDRLEEPHNSPDGYTGEKEDIDKKVQKLIDERMELHSLISKVVDDKMTQREAIHKLMMDKLGEALKREEKVKHDISEVTKIAKSPGNADANEYMRGMANGLVVADATVNNKHDKLDFVEPPKKPLEVKAQDIVKKESAPKGSPLKKFMERKKKPQEYKIEMAKSEKISCDDCGQTIFGSGMFSCCLCYGQDQYKKIWIKKSEDEISVKFSRSWDEENIQMLLQALRRKNG